MRAAASCACLAALATAGLAAADEGVRIELNCPALPSEERPALEARLRASLSVNHSRGGLVLFCRADRISATWQPEAGASTERSSAAPSDAAKLSDALLELAEQASRPDQRPPPSAPAAAAPAPAEPISPPPAAAEPAPSLPMALVISVGALGEFWWSSPAAALGPRGGVDLELGAIVLGLSAGVRAPIAPPDDISGRIVHASAVVDGALGAARQLSVGGGVEGCLVTVVGEAFGGSRTSTAASVLARGRWRIQGDRLRFSVGPELRAYLLTTTVYVERVEVWSIPRLTAGIGIDVGARVAGSK